MNFTGEQEESKQINVKSSDGYQSLMSSDKGFTFNLHINNHAQQQPSSPKRKNRRVIVHHIKKSRNHSIAPTPELETGAQVAPVSISD